MLNDLTMVLGSLIMLGGALLLVLYVPYLATGRDLGGIGTVCGIILGGIGVVVFRAGLHRRRTELSEADKEVW